MSHKQIVFPLSGPFFLITCRPWLKSLAMGDRPKSSPLWKETKPVQEAASQPQGCKRRVLANTFLGDDPLHCLSNKH